MIDRRWIGIELPPAPLTLERGRLQFFARAIGEDDPVYRDPEAARAAGHPDLPAPPTFLFAAELDADAAFWLVERLGVPLANILHGEQAFTYRRLVYAGEMICVRTRVADIYAKRGGALEFVVLDSTAVDAAERPVAELRSVWVVRHPESAGASADAARAAASGTETPALHEAVSQAALAPPRVANSVGPDDAARAVRPLAPGGKLPALTYPPLSRQTLALFAGASGDHNPIHIDLDFARAAGHPDVFAHGMLGMARLGRLLTRTVPQAALRHFAVRLTAVTHVGDALSCGGEVVDCFDEAGEARARLALIAQTADGVVTLRGEAVVAVPSDAA